MPIGVGFPHQSAFFACCCAAVRSRRPPGSSPSSRVRGALTSFVGGFPHPEIRLELQGQDDTQMPQGDPGSVDDRVHFSWSFSVSRPARSGCGRSQLHRAATGSTSAQRPEWRLHLVSVPTEPVLCQTARGHPGAPSDTQLLSAGRLTGRQGPVASHPPSQLSLQSETSRWEKRV